MIFINIFYSHTYVRNIMNVRNIFVEYTYAIFRTKNVYKNYISSLSLCERVRGKKILTSFSIVYVDVFKEMRILKYKYKCKVYARSK